jgi:hypothetical protein
MSGSRCARIRDAFDGPAQRDQAIRHLDTHLPEPGRHEPQVRLDLTKTAKGTAEPQFIGVPAEAAHT